MPETDEEEITDEVAAWIKREGPPNVIVGDDDGGLAAMLPGLVILAASAVLWLVL